MSLIRDETGAQTLLGYVVDLSDGTARSHLTIGPQHTNRHGGLHGGLMAALLDNAMGYAAALHFDPSAAPQVMTVSMTTSYLAPVRSGTVTASGTVTGGGRSLLFVDGHLHADDGRLLATASGIFKKIKPQP